MRRLAGICIALAILGFTGGLLHSFASVANIIFENSTDDTIIELYIGIFAIFESIGTFIIGFIFDWMADVQAYVEYTEKLVSRQLAIISDMKSINQKNDEHK